MDTKHQPLKHPAEDALDQKHAPQSHNPHSQGFKKIEPMEICHISSCERLINEPMVQQALDVQEHKE